MEQMPRLSIAFETLPLEAIKTEGEEDSANDFLCSSSSSGNRNTCNANAVDQMIVEAESILKIEEVKEEPLELYALNSVEDTAETLEEVKPPASVFLEPNFEDQVIVKQEKDPLLVDVEDIAVKKEISVKEEKEADAGIAMAAPREQRLDERTEDRMALLEVRMAQLVTSLRVDELIPKMEAVLRKLEENCPTTSDTLSSVLRAVGAASTTSSRVEMGLAKLEEKSRKTEKKLDDIENGVGKGLGGLEESLARMEERLVRMEERSGRTEQKMESTEEKIEKKLVRIEKNIEEGLWRVEERMTQLVTSLKVELESRSPTSCNSPPSTLPPADAASTSPGTATTPIPPMTSTTSDPLTSALPAVAVASTTSGTALTSPPPMTPEERKALGEALYKAAKEGRARDVQRLLQNGADVHYRREDWYNGTALHVAAQKGRVDALLIAAGADVNARDSTDWTPLHFAAFGKGDAVQKLICAGADVNSQAVDGETPLHKAVNYGNFAAAQALITAGADLNRQDSLGRTPLHGSASEGRKEIVKALIASGARKDIRNNYGKTPYDVADPSVRELLQP